MIGDTDADGLVVLAPCPDSPNCVSTLATDEEHGISPLAFRGSTDETMEAIVSVVKQMVRTRIITRDRLYLHAQYRTRIGFVDDVEFVLVEGEQRVDFRSASRVGYSDLGLNRRRMDEFISIYEGLD